MNIEQLKAFVTVVEEGSFRAAAVTLFKTQPTISASVKALEQQFNMLLLSRDSYRPTLTAEGKDFYQHAKLLIKQASELESLGHELAEGKPPTLSISLSAMCASPPGLQTIRQFCQQHADLQLNITTEHLSGVLEPLHNEKADVAIGPHVGLDNRYEYIEVDRVNMITVASPNSSIAYTQQPIAHSMLRHIPHILIADSGSKKPFDHTNILPSGTRWYVKDYQVKKALLLAGMGWARIPKHMVENELLNGELNALKVENFASQSQVPIYLIRLRNAPCSTLADEFWQNVALSLKEG